MVRRIWSSAAWHIACVTLFITVWELSSRAGVLNPAFFGRPSGIAMFLMRGFGWKGRLWLELGYTLLGAALSFILGSVAAGATGLLFAMFPRLHKATEPYLIFINAMPRIALTPLFILWLGLGLSSKVAVGISLVYFIVLASTLAGIRSVNDDHLIMSRTLGATPRQIFLKVTLPSAVPTIFAGLRLASIFSLLGVVGAELIAAQHGLGQTLAYLQSTFNMDGVMAVLLVLALLGLATTAVMNRIERRLLAWK
jgi:NitT/TauT family transport system permease protein